MTSKKMIGVCYVAHYPATLKKAENTTFTFKGEDLKQLKLNISNLRDGVRWIANTEDDADGTFARLTPNKAGGFRFGEEYESVSGIPAMTICFPRHGFLSMKEQPFCGRTMTQFFVRDGSIIILQPRPDNIREVRAIIAKKSKKSQAAAAAAVEEIRTAVIGKPVMPMDIDMDMFRESYAAQRNKTLGAVAEPTPVEPPRLQPAAAASPGATSPVSVFGVTLDVPVPVLVDLVARFARR